MPIAISGGNNRASFGASTVASLSTSASMISPLNPLPSPWASSSETPSNGFSLSNSMTSELSTATTSTSSGGGAIRLNRVPTSVRLAAELIKNNSAMSPPGMSAAQNIKLPSPAPAAVTPRPSPSSAPVKGTALPPDAILDLNAPDDISPSSSPSLGSASVRKSPRTIVQELGKGRPGASVPTTPMSTRNHTPYDDAKAAQADSRSNFDPSSTRSMPPPSFKAPFLPSQPRSRPSLPDPALQDAYGSAQSGRHRYRTSMHEATFTPPVAHDLTASPTPWSETSSSDLHQAFTGHQAINAPLTNTSMGLGLDMPDFGADSAYPRSKALSVVASSYASGTMTPGAGPSSSQPKMRSSSGKALAMDLAGAPSLGDAASHASMIMQSRQAKLQRWRPNSAGRDVGASVGRPVSET